MSNLGRHRRGYLYPGADDWFDTEFGDSKIVPADAIVIERGDLPEVANYDRVTRVVTFMDGSARLYGPTSPAALRDGARGQLALAEYLDRPSVGETQARALAMDMLVDDSPDWDRQTSADALDAARNAIAAGWTKPEVQR